MSAAIKKVPKDLKITRWEDLKPYYDTLFEAPTDSPNALQDLIQNLSDLICVYSEAQARAYIAMTCDTLNEDKAQVYANLSTQVWPHVEKACDKLNRKIVESPSVDSLDPNTYSVALKRLKNTLKLFHESNEPLKVELEELSISYRRMTGNLMAKVKGKDLPLPQASVFLSDPNRETRKEAWLAVAASRESLWEKLDVLYDKLVKLRHQVAKNAGFESFREYRHLDLKRLDWQPDACYDFHDSVKKYVVPFAKKAAEKHRESLGLKADDYRPWDIAGVPKGQHPLRPFRNGKELLHKTQKIFGKLKPEFEQNLKKMETAGLFDLESRKGKAPGGYNYPLAVTGMPFIFMNSAGTQRDLITLMHEGGHAMHTFLTRHLPLSYNKDTTFELAETASMGMELMTMEHWKDFYNEQDFKRACQEQIESCAVKLIWISVVDRYQHWVYTHPEATPEERNDYFGNLMSEFSTGVVNWDGLEEQYKRQWQRQLHIFELPFYYIDYGMAQICALQVYRNYKENPQQALDDYVAGLKLGSTKPLPETYKTMNVNFDFSENTFKDLMAFVENEWDAYHA